MSSKPSNTQLVQPNFITEAIEQDLQASKYPQIVTRFPPEPSGYAHLGHIFAGWLSYRTAKQYGGRFHLRMDDNNPELAKQEFVDAIIDDLRWLGLEWEEHLYFASDYFEQYYQYAEQLVKQGDAYVDSVSAAEMARLRGDSRVAGQPSPYRERTSEENLDLLKRMRAGEFADGQHVLRAKIDLASPNIKLRDPVLYRILHAEHYRTGRQWCIYPMYDFQHPLQDALEGISHSMCSLEFVDNRAIYDWLMDKLGFAPRPHQYEFGRRGLEYTITSKRKLRQLIAQGVVSGWDDPRLPTLRAQRRLGATPAAMQAFAEAIGVSRTNRTVDLTIYENALRDDLNQAAPRVMAVLEPLRVELSNVEPTTLSLPYWPHDVLQASPDGLASLPTGQRVAADKAVRAVPFGPSIYIERDDFSQNPPKGYKRLRLGGAVRLRGAGIIRADEIETDQEGNITAVRATWLGQDAKASGVIHWVSATDSLPAEFRLYDRLFKVSNPEGQNPEDSEQSSESAEPIIDSQEAMLRHLNPNNLEVKQGYVEKSVRDDPPQTRYQFERQGYFWQDPVTVTAEHPTERLVFGRIITLKDTWAEATKPAEPSKKPAAKQQASSPKASKQPTAHKPAELSEELAEKMAPLIQLGASEGDARTIAKDPVLLDFLTGAPTDDSYPQVASWTVNELVADLRAGKLKLTAQALAPLAREVQTGKIAARVAREALTRTAKSGEDPLKLIEREGLNTGLSDEVLASLVDEVLTANPDKVAAYRAGKTGLLGFFTGQVMRASKGKADPAALRQQLEQALS